MNSWLGIILGGGAFTTIVLGIYDRVSNRKFNRTKQDTAIKLDEATYREIASRASTVNDTNLMAVGAFWQGQFEELTKKFETEQDWRRRVSSRLRAHRAWDELLMQRLRAQGVTDMDPPPSLDPDEDEDEPKHRWSDLP